MFSTRLFVHNVPLYKLPVCTQCIHVVLRGDFVFVMNCCGFLSNMSSHFDHPLSACIGMFLLSLSISLKPSHLFHGNVETQVFIC